MKSYIVKTSLFKLLRLWGGGACLLLLVNPLYANIRIFPTGILFSKNNNTATLNIKNNSNKTVTYKISTYFPIMNEDGGISKTDNVNIKSLKRYLRFSPKKIVLKPFEEQLVRLILKFPMKLPEGDYRAHIKFQEQQPVQSKNPPLEEKKLVLNLIINMSLSVLVFYRHGSGIPDITLKDLILEDDKNIPEQKILKFKCILKGNYFAIGNLYAYFIPENGEKVQIGVMNGFSTFIPERKGEIKLKIPKSIDLKKGRVSLEYFESTKLGKKLLSSKVLQGDN